MKPIIDGMLLDDDILDHISLRMRELNRVNTPAAKKVSPASSRTMHEFRRHGWTIIRMSTLCAYLELCERPESLLGERSFRYALVSNSIDRDASYRWNAAKDMRRVGGKYIDRLAKYFLSSPHRSISAEELRYVLHGSQVWTSVIVSLKNQGWPIYTNADRAEVPNGMLIFDEQRSSSHTRCETLERNRTDLLHRDDFKCVRCGWRGDRENATYPVRLELHSIYSYRELRNEDLTTLCTVCHDLWHSIDADIQSADFTIWLDS